MLWKGAKWSIFRITLKIMLYYNSIFLLLIQFETSMMLLLKKSHVLLHIIFSWTLVENEVMATIIQACLYSKSGRLVIIQRWRLALWNVICLLRGLDNDADVCFSSVRYAIPRNQIPSYSYRSSPGVIWLRCHPPLLLPLQRQTNQSRQSTFPPTKPTWADYIWAHITRGWTKQYEYKSCRAIMQACTTAISGHGANWPYMTKWKENNYT